MCRNIKTLHNFAPPATEAEIRASSLQKVLPQVIRQEVNAYLDDLLGRRRPGRPRKKLGHR